MRVTRRAFLQALGASAVAAAVARGALTRAEEAGQRLKTWATPEETLVPAICQQCPGGCGVLVRVLDGSKKRVAVPVTVTGEKGKLEGRSRGETADLNDLLGFDLAPATGYTVSAGGVEKKVTTGAAATQQVVEIVLPTR